MRTRVSARLLAGASEAEVAVAEPVSKRRRIQRSQATAEQEGQGEPVSLKAGATHKVEKSGDRGHIGHSAAENSGDDDDDDAPQEVSAAVARTAHLEASKAEQASMATSKQMSRLSRLGATTSAIRIEGSEGNFKAEVSELLADDVLKLIAAERREAEANRIVRKQAAKAGSVSQKADSRPMDEYSAEGKADTDKKSSSRTRRLRVADSDDSASGSETSPACRLRIDIRPRAARDGLQKSVGKNATAVLLPTAQDAAAASRSVDKKVAAFVELRLNRRELHKGSALRSIVAKSSSGSLLLRPSIAFGRNGHQKWKK